MIFHCKQLKVQGTLHRIRWKEAAPDPLDSDFVEAIPRFLGHPAGKKNHGVTRHPHFTQSLQESHTFGALTIFNTVFLVVVSYIQQDNFAIDLGGGAS